MICGACKRGVEWDSLVVVERFGHEELRDLLTEWPWPRGSHLEVRVCACGGTLARVILREGEPRPFAPPSADPDRAMLADPRCHRR